MLQTKREKESFGRMHSQQLGEAWIQAITDGRLEQLQQFCQPGIISQVLTPKQFVTLDNAVDLVTKYRQWFGECTDIQVEASRIDQVGERLGIFYRFHLREHQAWFTIEQQLYSILKGGRVEELQLLCSGFQPAEWNGLVVLPNPANMGEPDFGRDELLEFYIDASDASSTCAVLTPAIRMKLREMQSGQVLEVRVDDPSAKGDLEAWCRLSGNQLLKVIDNEGPELRFFVKKK